MRTQGFAILVASTERYIEARARIKTLKIQFEVHVKHVAVAADWIRHGRVAHRTVIEQKPFAVQTKTALA
jgi:hypothetical protein